MAKYRQSHSYRGADEADVTELSYTTEYKLHTFHLQFQVFLMADALPEAANVVSTFLYQVQKYIG